ncbi:hypothetical protein B0J14DRAFT_662461 [Halenospora varia]|nr:hypothetical protein B0J14DRAFT_662461 [Halenospora varia]
MDRGPAYDKIASEDSLEDFQENRAPSRASWMPSITTGPAKAAIRMKQVVYTSAFRYNESSDGYYRDTDPTEPQYVGKPSKEIDDNWHKLLHDQYLFLSKEEAMKLDNPIAIGGNYLAE